MTFLSTVLAASETAIDLNTTTGMNIPTWTFPQLISWAVTAVLVVAGLIFFFMLLLGGVKWIMSGGDKAGTESARNQITAALIGLIIVFSAWAIARLLQTVFNINILQLDFGSVGGGTTPAE